METDNNKIYVIPTAEDKPIKVTFESNVSWKEDDPPLLTSLADTVVTVNIPCNFRPSAMMRMYGIRLKRWQEFVLDLEWRIKHVFKR